MENNSNATVIDNTEEKLMDITMNDGTVYYIPFGDWGLGYGKYRS